MGSSLPNSDGWDVRPPCSGYRPAADFIHEEDPHIRSPWWLLPRKLSDGQRFSDRGGDLTPLRPLPP